MVVGIFCFHIGLPPVELGGVVEIRFVRLHKVDRRAKKSVGALGIGN
jgi:hypothetical protein